MTTIWVFSLPGSRRKKGPQAQTLDVKYLAVLKVNEFHFLGEEVITRPSSQVLYLGWSAPPWRRQAMRMLVALAHTTEGRQL